MGGRAEDSGDGVIEEIEAMEKTELTQPQEDCQHQEMVLLILLAKKIRQKASVFFHMMWMRAVHLKCQIKFHLSGSVQLFKEDVKL
jgi:hypothetical protein